MYEQIFHPFEKIHNKIRHRDTSKSLISFLYQGLKIKIQNIVQSPPTDCHEGCEQKSMFFRKTVEPILIHEVYNTISTLDTLFSK